MTASTNLIGTSELDAVNIILAGIGEAPVQSLDQADVSDMGAARSRLRETSRLVQATGWRFNTDRELPLALQPDGRIRVSPAWLSVELSEREYGREAVVRGGFLWDNLRRTFTWDRAVFADVVTFLSWEDLPEAFRRYIALHSARLHQASVLGSGALDRGLEAEARNAWAEVMRYDTRTAKRNVYNAPDMGTLLDRSPSRLYIPT